MEDFPHCLLPPLPHPPDFLMLPKESICLPTVFTFVGFSYYLRPNLWSFFKQNWWPCVLIFSLWVIIGNLGVIVKIFQWFGTMRNTVLKNPVYMITVSMNLVVWLWISHFSPQASGALTVIYGRWSMPVVSSSNRWNNSFKCCYYFEVFLDMVELQCYICCPEIKFLYNVRHQYI